MLIWLLGGMVLGVLTSRLGPVALAAGRAWRTSRSRERELRVELLELRVEIARSDLRDRARRCRAGDQPG